MDPNIKKQWLKDLRSGKFKQGKYKLCKIDREGETRFCCLGVLAHRVVDKPWREYETCDNGRVQIFAYGRYPGTLSKGVLSKVGMKLEDQSKLIRMNDGGVPFKKIADWIEKNL